MSLTKEQLQELMDAITERLQEFELPMPSAVLLTKGAVRIAHEVIMEFIERERTTVTVVKEHAAPKPAAKVEAAPASDKLALTLGVEHTLVTPLRSQEGDDVALGKRHADFYAIIDELQRLAMGGMMPSMSTWDASRKAPLPKAQAVVNRFQKGWAQLAEVAGLQMERKRVATNGLPHINGTWNGDE